MDWELKGTVVVACNCDSGCPCNFNALPTTGNCEGTWTWHVERGNFGETSLDDLNFNVCVNWPGAIHEGNGEALILVDERSDEAQRKAIEALVGGDGGGPWGRLWGGVGLPRPANPGKKAGALRRAHRRRRLAREGGRSVRGRVRGD